MRHSHRFRINQIKHGNSYYKNWNRSSKEYKKWMILCYRKEIENTKKLLQEEKIEESTAHAYERTVRNKIKLISSVEGFSLIVKETLQRISLYIINVRRIRDIFSEMQNKKKSKQHLKDIALKQLQANNAEYIMEYVKSNITPENEEMLKEIILYYQGVYLISSRLRLAKINKYEKKKADIKAMQLERNIIQSLFEKGEISWNIASELRKNLNYIESDVLR